MPIGLIQYWVYAILRFMGFSPGPNGGTAIIPAETASGGWYLVTQNSSNSPNDTRLNQILLAGYNIGVGATVVKAGEPALALAFESYYAPNGSDKWFEFHLDHILSNGTMYRPMSFSMDRDGIVYAGVQFCLSSFIISDPTGITQRVVSTSTNPLHVIAGYASFDDGYGQQWGNTFIQGYNSGPLQLLSNGNMAISCVNTLVGINTAGGNGQLEVHCVSAAIPTIIAQGAASRASPLIQLQTSAGASLGNVGGCAFDNIATVSSTSTNGTLDTIFTKTTVANTLAVNGDKIYFDFTLTTVGHATATRRFVVSYAGIAIMDSTAQILGATAGVVRIFGYVIRLTATTARAVVTFHPTGSATLLGFEKNFYTTDATLSTLTLTGTNILLLTAAAASTGAASADIAGVHGTISIIPAGS